MKTLKRIGIIAILLLVTVIIFTSFFGVYKKEDFRVVNLIKDYKLGMQFTDAHVLKMTVSEDEKEIIYDSEGNIVEDDGKTEYTEENGYKTETVKINKDEDLTLENYKLAKKIIKNRLKGMQVGEYKVNLNEENGEITVEIQESDDAEEIIHHLEGQGEFVIRDKDTEQVLIDNKYVESAKTLYGPSDETGTSTTIYLQIDFNEEGAKKLEEISKIYIAEEHVHEEGEEHSDDEEIKAKYVSVVLDGTTLSSTYFGETMSTGILYIPITQASDNDTLMQYSQELNHITTIINNGKLPVVYEYSENTIQSSITKNMLAIGILIPVVIMLIACVVLVVKFKANGFIATFLQIGYIALLLLALRYTNVVITIEGIVGIIISVILNYILVYAMLNSLKKNEIIEWNLIAKFGLKTIPVYIISIILAFNGLTRVNSLGMTLVWGSFCLYIYNLAITRNVLKMMNK